MIYCLQKCEEEDINTINFLEIEEIKKDLLITKENYIRVLKVYPINYDLKSDFEKESIINAYKTVLKTCAFDFQILVLSQKENIDQNIEMLNNHLSFKIDCLDKEKLFGFKEDGTKQIEFQNDKLNDIYSNYISFITKLNYEENITSKSFYIILSHKRFNKNINNFNFIKLNNLIKNRKVLNKRNDKNKENNQNTSNGIDKNNNKPNFQEIKILDDNEKKIIISLERCGNIIKRLNSEEIYELFKFSQKGE